MESATKKRKIFHDDDEDDEEEKMEKFYALVKSIREARDRLMINSSGAAEGKSKKRKLEEEKQVAAVWKPSFQREDFVEEVQLRKAPVTVASTSQSKEGTDDQKEEVKEGLDLSLSL